MSHGLFVLAIISNVQSIHNVLGNGADECIRNCHDDGVNENAEVCPIVELGLVFPVPVVSTLHQHQGQEDGTNRDSHQEYYNQDNLGINAAPPLLEDNLLPFTLLLVENVLSVDLLQLDRSFNLFLPLLQSPCVAKRGMLSLPTLQVEGRPKCNEYDVSIVNGVVRLDAVALKPSLVILLAFKPKVDLKEEKDGSSDSWYDQPAQVMVHERQVKCILLSKVVGYQINWLHMVQE